MAIVAVLLKRFSTEYYARVEATNGRTYAASVEPRSGGGSKLICVTWPTNFREPDRLVALGRTPPAVRRLFRKHFQQEVRFS